MPTPNVRLMIESDVPAVARIHVDVWNETYRGIIPDEQLDARTYEGLEARWSKQFASEEQKVSTIVAEYDGEIAGFCVYSATPQNVVACHPEINGVPCDSELCAMNILKNYHRRGIGRALTEQVWSDLKSDGRKSPFLWVVDKNTNAINFYERVGGKRLKQVREEDGVTELAYGWQL